MPVTRLLVEGDLDAALLVKIFAGDPLVDAHHGSKYALNPRVRAERRKRKDQNTFYLRDRDFDHEPSGPPHIPVIERSAQGDEILGWRWYRHEIENYMLEPSIVQAATGIEPAQFCQALTAAAKRIRCYQAARWTIGLSRVGLPRHYDFQTHPDEARGKDFYLPEDLTEKSLWRWVERISHTHLRLAQTALDPLNLTQLFHEKIERFSDAFLDNSEDILIWFSGKDLIKALETWLMGQSLPVLGEFQAKIREWMRRYPDEVLTLLPEWREFVNIVRSQP